MRNSRGEFVYEPNLSRPAKSSQLQSDSSDSSSVEFTIRSEKETPHRRTDIFVEEWNGDRWVRKPYFGEPDPPRSPGRIPSDAENKPGGEYQGPYDEWASWPIPDELDPSRPAKRTPQNDKTRPINEWVDNTLNDTSRTAGDTTPADSDSNLQYDEVTKTYIPTNKPRPASKSSKSSTLLGVGSGSRPTSKRVSSQHGASETTTSDNRLHQPSTANGVEAPKTSSPRLDKDVSTSQVTSNQTEIVIQKRDIAVQKRPKRTSGSQPRPSTPRRVRNSKKGKGNSRQQGGCCVVL